MGDENLKLRSMGERGLELLKIGEIGDRSLDMISVAVGGAVLMAMAVVYGMETKKYRLYWFFHTLAFASLWFINILTASRYFYVSRVTRNKLSDENDVNSSIPPSRPKERANNVADKIINDANDGEKEPEVGS